MPNFEEEKELIRCSFCGKTQDQVKKIIAGPDVYICDECEYREKAGFNGCMNIEKPFWGEKCPVKNWAMMSKLIFRKF